MKKRVLILVLAALLTLALAVPVFAHSAPPCNDTDGDGFASGREFAEHHIVPLATTGELGAGGHVPGAHQGFSLCDPSAN